MSDFCKGGFSLGPGGFRIGFQTLSPNAVHYPKKRKRLRSNTIITASRGILHHECGPYTVVNMLIL